MTDACRDTEMADQGTDPITIAVTGKGTLLLHGDHKVTSNRKGDLALYCSNEYVLWLPTVSYYAMIGKRCSKCGEVLRERQPKVG